METWEEGLPPVALVPSNSKAPQVLVWAGEHVGPGELPQPHQILPLRLQPLLLCPRQPHFLLRYLDTHRQDQLRVLCGLVLRASADLVQGPGHLGHPHHGPRPPGLRGGPQGAALSSGPVFWDVAAPVRHADHPGNSHLHPAGPAGAEGAGRRAGHHPELPRRPGGDRGRGELGLRAVPAALLRLAFPAGLVRGPERQRVRGPPGALLLLQLVGHQRLRSPRQGLLPAARPARAAVTAQAQHGPLRGAGERLHLPGGLRAEPTEVAAQQPHFHRGHLPGRRSTRARLHDAVHFPVPKPGPRVQQAGSPQASRPRPPPSPAPALSSVLSSSPAPVPPRLSASMPLGPRCRPRTAIASPAGPGASCPLHFFASSRRLLTRLFFTQASNKSPCVLVK
ncbi:leukocyte antigen CD37 isoform X3 [Oryctolagus cuniculus]|uniref:leukocyte antigen CD37 isoform X3 n=1 Tax=Oryctolagus cuniculus TaxID=9986 RepID=UPI00387A6450